MKEQMTFLDFLPEDEATKFRPQKSTDWKWTFSDYPKEKNGLKVFSCFACGGGSTMGYKLAGCDVLGCCEIDPKMNDVYVRNHNPKYNFLMDIRDFNNIPDDEIPQELFDIDILDGSPPCTTFSMAGDREDSWGKKKKFREGQKEQTLDDLSFVFIDTVKKLKPKTVIMENVEGLLLGEAWSYVQRVYKEFKDAGYQIEHWLLKGEQMGIPQTRHRVFFIAVRNDIEFDLDRIDMSFNYIPVTYGEIKSEIGNPINPNIKAYNLLCNATKNDKDLGTVHERIYGTRAYFNEIIAHDNEVLSTIRASHKQGFYRFCDKTYTTENDTIHAQTFPEDYNFLGFNVGYICGMSVPPVMMKRVVERLIESGLYNYK